MTPRFKVGDIVVMEDTYTSTKYCMVIESYSTTEYIYKDLKTQLVTSLEFYSFENEGVGFLETRLITDEEKLEYL